LKGTAFGLFHGWPFNVSGFISLKAVKTLHRMASLWQVKAVHVHRLRMMPYALGLGLPYMLDATDSMSNYFKIARRGLPGWRKLYAWIDYPAIRQFERKWSERAAATLVTTDAEREHIRKLGVVSPVVVVPNGIDLRKWPYKSPKRRGREVLFLGTMCYPPNSAGLEWFLRHVAGPVALREPETLLRVVGQGVSKRLRRLANKCGMNVEFAGFIPDARNAFHRSALLACSLPVAAGIQNKAIQAFACGTPVVATPNVAGALGAVNGRELLVGDGPEMFASAVVRLLKDGNLRERLARNANRYARRNWPESRAGNGLRKAEAFLARSAGKAR
jgi:polysaccharide biosynthesis protein PslH